MSGGAIISDFIPAIRGSRRVTADMLWSDLKKSSKKHSAKPKRSKVIDTDDEFEAEKFVAEFQELMDQSDVDEIDDDFYDWLNDAKPFALSASSKPNSALRGLHGTSTSENLDGMGEIFDDLSLRVRRKYNNTHPNVDELALCGLHETGMSKNLDGMREIMNHLGLHVKREYNNAYANVDELALRGLHETGTRENFDELALLGMREYNNTHPNVDELALRRLPENDHIIVIDQDNFNHGTNQSGDISTPKKVSLEWIFIIINFILELPSAVFDQLSSVHKPQYVLIAMLMSFIAIFFCIFELIYKGRKERVTWKWRSKIPWFYYSSPSDMRFGTFADFVGLGCAIPQFIITTINYPFFLRQADNPIKISVWPIIFAFGLLCFKFLENPNRSTTVPRYH